MIQCLIIGDTDQAEKYKELFSKINYFGKTTCIPKPTTDIEAPKIDYSPFDAIIIVSQLSSPFPLFNDLIKEQKNVYFVDQPNFSDEELLELDKIQQESGNLMVTEIPEMENPLTDEFITTNSGYLQFRYEKSIPNKRLIRSSLFSALCILSVLSPMQVKKIDVNTLESTNEGKPIIRIRLKMFDSSLCYILLKIENKNDHQVIIESDTGHFIFNLTENFLENKYGKRFNSTHLDEDSFLIKSIESFALKIILDKKPTFSFHNYTMVSITLSRIESILRNSF